MFCAPVVCVVILVVRVVEGAKAATEGSNERVQTADGNDFIVIVCSVPKWSAGLEDQKRDGLIVHRRLSMYLPLSWIHTMT